MNQQRGLAEARIRSLQELEFRAKFLEQTGRGSLLADLKAHAVGPVDALGKGTQPEADDGLFHPPARGRDDCRAVDESHPSTGHGAHSVMASTSSILILRPQLKETLSRCNSRFPPR